VLTFPLATHGGHAGKLGTFALIDDGQGGRFGSGGMADRVGQFAEYAVSKTIAARCATKACDKASPGAAVMLHLRSRYVSKAAILTVPILFVPVENRSPA
jgi:hypothetical protein